MKICHMNLELFLHNVWETRAPSALACVFDVDLSVSNIIALRMRASQGFGKREAHCVKLTFRVVADAHRCCHQGDGAALAASSRR